MNRKTDPKKPKKDVKKQIVRIFVLFLAFLMVAGTLATVLVYFTADQRANDAVPAVQAASTALFSTAASSLRLRIGLAYGSSTVKTAPLSSSTGFSFGPVTGKTALTVTMTTDKTKITVLPDRGYTFSSGSEKESDSADMTTGAYAVLLPDSFGTGEDAVKAANEKVASLGTYAYRAYLLGREKLLVGAYPTADAARAASLNVGKVIPGTSVLAPTNTALRAVDPGTGRVLFKFDGASTGKEFGIAPNAASGVTYPAIGFRGPNGKYDSDKFEGVLEFKRTSSTAVTVVNIVPLEAYVAGVIPWEIGVKYGAEAIKAFAVTVRNYTMNARGVHDSKYGFDLCCTSDCQVYRGCANSDSIRSYVKATEGIVATYGGKLEKQYYSSVAGGTTADSADIWSGTVYDYLRGRPTPWENYESKSHGKWTKQYTPAELYTRLKTRKGCEKLKTDIASVKILATSLNSNYVAKVEIRDKNGNTAVLTGSDTIRTAFGLDSANFVVGKAGETVRTTEYGLSGYGSFADIGVGYLDLDVITADGRKTFNAQSGIKALTGSGVKDIPASFWLNTSGQKLSYDAYISPDLPKIPGTKRVDFNKLSVVSREVSVTLKGDSGKFVFDGRGWGHGLGASQEGYNDLAGLGYTWKEIIGFYFPGSGFDSVEKFI